MKKPDSAKTAENLVRNRENKQERLKKESKTQVAKGNERQRRKVTGREAET